MPDLSIDQQKREQLRLDYAGTFGTPAGRRVLWDILTRCHIFRTTFAPNRPDLSAFKEGERNIGLQIIDIMQVRDIEELQNLAEM